MCYNQLQIKMYTFTIKVLCYKKCKHLMTEVRIDMKKMPLYKQIKQQIKDKIISGELRYKDRVPSEQEIMDEYQVSKITVKNALIGLAEEGWVTRIQGKGTFVCWNEQEESNHTPSEYLSGHHQRGSSSIPTAHLPLIGLIIPTMKTSVIQKMIDYTEYYAGQLGYQLILHITRESSSNETEAIVRLLSIGAQGMIVFPTEDEKYNESLLRLSLDKFPFVFMDRYLRNIETFRITSDNLSAAYEAIVYLLSKKHRHIALISPDRTNTVIEDRTSGFEKAYIDHHISIDKNLWCHIPLDILRNEQGKEYITHFMNHHSQVTAVLALSAEAAKLTYASLVELGKTEDVELISFDNPELPGIGYLKQDERTIARLAVELVHAQIKGNHEPQHKVVQVSLNLQQLI